MSVYTQNHNIDGWPVCKNGEPMGRKDCLAELQKLEAENAALKEENERLKTRVAELVEVLKRIAAWPDGGKQYGQASIKIFASEALAAYRKTDITKGLRLGS